MSRTLAILALCIFSAGLFGATTVSGDITTDTTWDSTGSPYTLDPPGTSTGNITVRNGATLTIDSSGGAVTVQWNENCDLIVGLASSEQGTLKINASTNAISFLVRTGGNVRIANNGQLLYSATTGATTFTRFNSSNTWGALVFEAGQTRQSEVKNSTFQYGGNDSREGMIVVEDSASFTPTLNKLTFNNQPATGKAAIRLNGRGVNALQEGAITLPFDVSGVTYAFYVGAGAIATVPRICFPDITTPDTPTAYLAGTWQVGDSSNCSIVTFADAYTFKCATSSKVQIVNGALWGSSECQTIFETSSASPSYTNWVGLVDDSSSKANVFGGVGPFAYLTVRNASTGVDINKGVTYVPVGGQQTDWCFPGLVIRKCSTGFRVRTQLDSDGAGYCTILKNAEIGAPSSTDDCNVNCVLVDYGRVVLDGCQLKGSVSNAVNTGTTSVSQRTHVSVRDCRISDTATSTASTAINNNSCQGNCDLIIERTIVEGWRTGISFFQTSTGTYTPARTLTMRNSFISGDAVGTDISSTGINIQIQTAAVCTVLIEDCTISGVNKTGTGTARGFWLQQLRSSSSMSVRRTNIDSNTDYGVDVVSATNNTCQYNFEECSFTFNGDGGTDEGGIRDRRTQSAKVVANHCTFAGNNPRGATDNNSTQQMLAENCYWNASNGPGGSGPGSGDAVSTNVDYSPFLARPCIGYLLGGSPAGCAVLGVKESAGTAYPDQLHIIANTNYVVAWTFGSDFAGSTQASYEIDIDDTANFSSLVHNGSKTASASNEITVATSLTDGIVYYVRIRLWDSKDRPGPHYYSTFRLNTAPPQVGDTNRSPGVIESNPAVPTIGDATPQLIWERPADSNVDPVQFYVDVDTANTYNTANLRQANSTQVLTNGMFEISTDSGTTWIPFPSSGAPAGQTIRVRLTSPTTWPNGLGTLTTATTWYWRVRANDKFEYGSYSTNFKFTVSRSYDLSGKLVDTAGAAVSGATIKVARNNTVLGASASTNGSGDFTLSITDDLVQGDALAVFRDGGTSTTRSARLVQFTGGNMTGLNLRYKRAYVQQTQADPIINTDFSNDFGVDADIPWTETSGAITFSGDLAGSGEGVIVEGAWEIGAYVVDCNSNDVEFRIATSGRINIVGTAELNLHYFDNAGLFENRYPSKVTLLIDGLNSVSTGQLKLYKSTLTLQKAGGLTFTVSKGVTELQQCTVNVGSGDVSTVKITGDPAFGEYGILDCTGCTFSKVGLLAEADAIIAAFNNNSFNDGIDTRHIWWKTTNPRSAGVMRGIVFNYNFIGGLPRFNVEADSGAKRLDMVGCGGGYYGEWLENDPGTKVFWSQLCPVDVRVTLGDTRIKLDWAADPQAQGLSAGYNVYRTTNPNAAPPWGTPINGGTPLTTNTYNDTGLTNGTTYHYYITCIDTAPATDVESGGSARVSATPGEPALDVLTPSTVSATSVVGMTAIGIKTHWDGSASFSSTGSGVVLNDTIVLSPTLALLDFTFNSAGVGTNTVTAARNDVWGITTYDESRTKTYTVAANSNLNRPSVSFTTTGGAIGQDGNTSGAFVIDLDFNANSGAAIDTTKFEFFASRSVQVSGTGPVVANPGETMGTGSKSIFDGAGDVLNASGATANIEQTSNNLEELFSDGEYTVSARIGNTDGRYSEWVTRRFYVNGASTAVAKTTSLVKQGALSASVLITGTFPVNVNGVSFGSNITTVSFTKDSSSQVTAIVNVDELAACGPRTFTVDLASGTDPAGIVIVEYPTNILPTTTNAEPNRNPAVGGLNVFLKNGEFFKSETDIATRGRMMGISWSRFYRNQNTYDGPLGHGWMGYYFQRLVFNTSGGGSDLYDWYTPDGRKESFSVLTSNGEFNTAPSGIYARIDRDQTHQSITMTDRHGFKCVFNAQGRLWRCIDRNGNKVECEYNYAGQLVKITDDRRKNYTIAYATHGRVTSVTDNVASPARVIDYVYDSSGDLIEQKAPTTGRYDGSPLPRISYVYRYIAHRLTECVNPNEVAQGGTPVSYMENRYEYDANSGTWRVVAQRLGGQDQWLYLRYVSGTVIREIDRLGRRTEWTIDGNGRATQVERFTAFWSVDTEDPIDHAATPTQTVAKLRASDPSSFVTTFTYNSNNEVVTVKHPRAVAASYGSGTTEYTYPDTTQQTSGTATSNPGADVLVDNTKSWTNDAYLGMTLRVGSTAGTYKYYPIKGNDANSIKIDALFSLSGDGWLSGVSYSVHTNNPDALGAGDVLKVTRRDYLGVLSNLVTEYTYEPRYHFVQSVKNPRGYITKYHYDYMLSASATDASAGNLVRVESPGVTLGQPSTQTINTYMTYNEYGQLLSSTDGEGNVTINRYYADAAAHDGFLYQRVSAYGVLDLTSEFDWDSRGNMIAQWPSRSFEAGATKDDYKTAYTVNELDQVVKVTGRLLRTSGADRKDTYFYYDANGNLTDTWDEYVTSGGSQPTDPADFTSQSGFSKPTSAMATGWIQSSTTYDILNRPTTRTIDAVPGSVTERYTSFTYYDRNDNVIDAISPLGNRSRRVYDERDLTYQSIAGADSDVAATFTTNYDANGNVSSSLDARGNSSTYAYDGFDRSTTATDPAGNYRETVYDVNGNVTESRAKNAANALLAQSTMYFDELDRAYKSERMAKDFSGNSIGDGLNTSTTLFDKNSRVTSSTDDNGVTMLRFYDAANRVTYTRDPAGNEVQNIYNADGAVTKTTFREKSGLTNASEVSHVEYTLDRMNRKIAFRDQRYADGTFDTEVDYAYDSRNRLVTFTDAGGITTDYVYDSLDRNTRTTRKPTATDTTWTITDTAYDKQSRVTKRTIYESPDDVTPTAPQDTTYEYDERDRLKLVRRADGDIFQRFYDANGNIIEWRDPLGNIVNQTFDARNLMVHRNITRATNTVGATSETYQYDGLGRLTSCSNYENTNLITATQWAYNTQSQPESTTQTLANHSGTIIGTYTTGAEYNASGLNTATIYSSGTRVEHTFDQRNRLLNTYDVSHAQDIASYYYSGSRLVQRVNGNGTVTDYGYESSGCGCGGFSSFCTSVTHWRVSDGEELFKTERRYDVRGRVMTERRAHEGDLGMVYRYDDTDRLTTMFTGADLYNTAIDTHVSGSGPTVFGIKRTWNLDPRGNRSGSQGVRDIDDGNGGASTTILDTSVTLSTDKMNLYTDVGGKAYEFDAIEQMTRDRSTETYLRYDWRGQLWLSDDDSDFSSPERYYTYDCQGRRKIEEQWYEASHHLYQTLVYTSFTACATGNCSGDIAGDFTEMIRTLDANGLLLSSTEHMIGLGAHGTGSSSATHPAAIFGPGGRPAGDVIVAERVVQGATIHTYWRCEDQLNSCIGQIDENGWRTMQTSYLAFGEALQSRVLFDGAMARWTAIDTDTPGPGQSTITLDGSVTLSADSLNGAMLYLARPGEGVDRHMETNVVDTTSGTIIIDDPSGTFAAALAEATGDPTHFAPPINDFVIFAFNDSKVANAPTYQTQGTWTSAPSYAASQTTFTDADADDNGGGFASWMIGAILVPDVNIGAPLIITATTATTLTVAGDARGIASNGSQYIVYAAPFTDPAHGTFETDIFKGGSVYLWAGYRYQPPQLGFRVDPPGAPAVGVYGASTGSNRLGQYYAWNRNYDINTGRWTTPDPVFVKSWKNNFGYVLGGPINWLDPTGLSELSEEDYLKKAREIIDGGTLDPDDIFRKLIEYYFENDPEDDWFWDCQDDMEELFDALGDLLATNPSHSHGDKDETDDEKRFRKVRNWVENVHYDDKGNLAKNDGKQYPETNPKKKFKGQGDKFMHLFAGAAIAANAGETVSDGCGVGVEIGDEIKTWFGGSGSGYDSEDLKWGKYGSELENAFDVNEEDCRALALKFKRGTLKLSEPEDWNDKDDDTLYK